MGRTSNFLEIRGTSWTDGPDMRFDINPIYGTMLILKSGRLELWDGPPVF